jgi:pectate lyase
MRGTLRIAIALSLLIGCSTGTGAPGSPDAGDSRPDGGAAGSADANPIATPDAAPGSADAAVVAGPDCDSVPYDVDDLLDQRVGFGANAQGGDPNNLYHVTTLADSGSGSLRAGLESSQHYWIVFDVEGEITLDSDIRVKSYKTVDGRGRDVTVNGPLLMIDVRHVIVTDMHLSNDTEGHCTQDGDVVSLRGDGGATPDTYSTRDIWFHHVEFFNGGDGLLDLRGASNVTVSWSHFHTHKKGLLMSRTTDGDDADGMYVTMHHNFFDRVSLRGPQFIYGRIHYFNNYQYQWYEYGAGGLSDAEFRSENNVYEARPGAVCIPNCPDPNPCGDDDFFVSKDGLVFDWSDNGPGNVRSDGDLALEEAVLNENNRNSVFDPAAAYVYTAEPATTSLAAAVAADSGPRIGYCAP